MSYIILFISALGAASLLPLSSELVLISLLTEYETKHWSVAGLWLVATIGNTLGAGINALLGFYLTRFQNKTWFPVSKAQLTRAKHWFQRYGQWSLLLSWLPIIGDALTVAAGVFRTKIWLFFVLVTLGKGARYAVIIGIFYGVVNF